MRKYYFAAAYRHDKYEREGKIRVHNMGQPNLRIGS